MMSILIKGMEMPKNCMLCPFCVEEADPANGEMCMVTGKLMPPCNRERLDDCPLVPVPPHGDLIDKDATMNEILEQRGEDTACWFAGIVNDMTAIIPSDKAEEGET